MARALNRTSEANITEGGAQERGRAPEERRREIQIIAQALEEAYERKEQMVENDEDTAELDRTIIELRRKLRCGGRLKPGDFLNNGRFKLVRPLGTGGFATVWKSYDRQKHLGVAIKVLHGQFAKDRSRRERFFRGARQMKEIHHRGVVRVIENKLEDQGFYYFVMEYLSGGDLRQRVLDGLTSQEEIITIILTVAEALQFTHDHGIVHRDIKPANILLSETNEPKLTDFDLVRAPDTTGGTRTGMLGSVMYAAPESMSSPADVGAEADVYSLGMTTIFSLYGADLPLEVMRDARVFISRLHIGSEMREALWKAVRWERTNRWKTVRDFSTALKSCLSSYAQSLDRGNRKTDIVSIMPFKPRAPSPEYEDFPAGLLQKIASYHDGETKDLYIPVLGAKILAEFSSSYDIPTLWRRTLAQSQSDLPDSLATAVEANFTSGTVIGSEATGEMKATMIAKDGDRAPEEEGVAAHELRRVPVPSASENPTAEGQPVVGQPPERRPPPVREAGPPSPEPEEDVPFYRKALAQSLPEDPNGYRPNWSNVDDYDIPTVLRKQMD